MAAWGKSARGQTSCLRPSPQPLQPSQWGTPRDPAEKDRILALVAEVHIKRMIFMSPDACIFPIHRKLLNSFSLFNSNLFMLQLPLLKFLCYKNSDISYPPHSYSISSALSKGCISGLSLSFVHQIKHNSQLLGCGHIFSVHAMSLQLCWTLYDPMDYNPPGSSVHWIL